MGTEEHVALVRRFYDEVWNRGNVDVAAEVFADDYLRHDLRPSQAAPGPAGQARIAAEFRAAFPDLRMEIDLILADGDLVAARWTTEGTNTGAWGGREPTGRHAVFSGVNIFRIRKGKGSSCGTTGTTSASCSSSGRRSSRARPRRMRHRASGSEGR